jgi:pilus assembly protein Flp/PilA
MVRRQSFFSNSFSLRKTNMRKFFSNKKGQGLVEYGLIIAGVALICAAAVSVFGHKTSDLISAVATILPGAHEDDNAAMTSGKLIETTAGTATAPISLDATAIAGNSATSRLGVNVGLAAPTDFGGLIVE